MKLPKVLSKTYTLEEAESSNFCTGFDRYSEWVDGCQIRTNRKLTIETISFTGKRVVSVLWMCDGHFYRKYRRWFREGEFDASL